MWSRTRARRAGCALVALAAVLCAAATEAQARRKKPYWMISFVGGALVPVGQTADERDLGLGVGVRVGYTTRSGLGLALAAEYSPLPVAEPAAGSASSADGDGSGNQATGQVVTESHFVAAALLPRYTLGHGTVRLTLGAGGGGIMEQTRSRPAGDENAATESVAVFAPAAMGELGLDTYLWDSGGLVVSGSYVRSFGDREAQVAAVLGGLVFSFH